MHSAADIVAMTDAAVEGLQEPMQVTLSEAMRHAVSEFAIGRAPAMPDDFRAKLTQALIDGITPAARSMGEAVLDTLRKDDAGLFERVVQAYIDQFGGIKIERIAASTLRQVQGLIAAGAQDGDSVDQIARTLFDRIPDIARYRAAVIARTETHSASQFASVEVAKTINKPLMKAWNSVEDHRTRDFLPDDVSRFDHRSMNGVQVAMDQPFRVPKVDGTFESLMFPGDPTGSAGNVINCRCVVTYKIV